MAITSDNNNNNNNINIYLLLYLKEYLKALYMGL